MIKIVSMFLLCIVSLYSSEGSSLGTGTGFFINKNGYLLTNEHVVRDAESITVLLDGERIKAKIVKSDRANDIALLKINKIVQPLVLNKKNIKQGEEISVIGFPNIGIQGSEIKSTFGFINAITGLNGDARFFQIDAPIQPGNSGSPLLNSTGEVVGIVSSSVNQLAMMEMTGTIAQNVNYAVKIAYALPLLSSQNVSYSEISKNQKINKVDLIEVAKNSIVLVIAEKKENKVQKIEKVKQRIDNGLTWEKNIASAVERASKEEKPLMVLVTKIGCKWCDVLKQKTLKDPKVTAILNRDFVLYEGVVEEGSVPPSLMTQGTPATWFIKGKAPMFEPIMGAVESDDFLKALDIVKLEYKKSAH